MHKRPLAERFLSLVIGAPPAAALYGDLEELAFTRSRLWFWTAYIRTVVTLGWRTPVAFVISLISMTHIFGTVLPWLLDHRTHHLSDPGLFGQENLRTSLILWNLSIAIAHCLCFALPFIAVRFGIRNRLTQLTCALFFFAMPVYSFTPWLRDLSTLLTLLAILIALALPVWRPPLAVLSGTILAATFFQAASAHLLVGIYQKNYFLIPTSTRVGCDNLAFALAVIVCLYLSRVMLRHPQKIA